MSKLLLLEKDGKQIPFARKTAEYMMQRGWRRAGSSSEQPTQPANIDPKVDMPKEAK